MRNHLKDAKGPDLPQVLKAVTILEVGGTGVLMVRRAKGDGAIPRFTRWVREL